MARYTEAVDWISRNDEISLYDQESYPISVLLVADLFKREPKNVLKDVIANTEKTLESKRSLGGWDD